MLCDGCHAAEAVFHLTRIENGVSETVHLCNDCAAKRGISAQVDLVSGEAMMLEAAPVEELPLEGPILICHACGMTLPVLQSTWRVGCARCWETFDIALRTVVRQIQGSTTHSGKQYDGGVSTTPDLAVREVRERERLAQALSAAVAAERFEDAATLRDQLRVLDQ